jgi:FK506-binding nuclear protein
LYNIFLFQVHVYYVGRLKSNNKKFDSNESGKGFSFKLGKQEVIKGWDLGIEGM